MIDKLIEKIIAAEQDAEKIIEEAKNTAEARIAASLQRAQELKSRAAVAADTILHRVSSAFKLIEGHSSNFSDAQCAQLESAAKEKTHLAVEMILDAI